MTQIVFDTLYEDEIDYTGHKFGEWTVLGPSIRYGKDCKEQNTKRYWWCQCSCGTIKEVYLSNLKRRRSTKCVNCKSRTHGSVYNPLYKVWKTVKERCYYIKHASYKYYGGRGIKLFPRWQDVNKFIVDVEELIGPRPYGYDFSRLNNDGNYEPGNVKWERKNINAQEQWRQTYEVEMVDIFYRALRRHFHLGLIERWDHFNEFEKYEFSTYGKASTRTRLAPSGHLQLYLGGKIRSLHRCIYGLFTSQSLDTFGLVMHLNDNPQDNRIWNLIEGTHTENMHMKAYNYERVTNHEGVHLWWLPESQCKELMPVSL